MGSFAVSIATAVSRHQKIPANNNRFVNKKQSKTYNYIVDKLDHICTTILLLLFLETSRNELVAHVKVDPM